ETRQMTHWFKTNYHYIVPEFRHNQQFDLHPEELLETIRQAKAKKINAKPVILGPLSYLYLGKTKTHFNRLDLLPKLLAEYQKLFDLLGKENIEWVQIDEPIFILDLKQEWLKAFKHVYT